MNQSLLDSARDLARAACTPRRAGRVAKLTGTLVEAWVPGVRVGDLVDIAGAAGAVPCEVVGFSGTAALAVPMAPIDGVAVGALAERRDVAGEILVGDELLGRVVDAFGRPIDGAGPLHPRTRQPVDPPALSLRERAPISLPFATGVRAIDAILPCGRGQRVGIFAGAGVGKSVLVEQIARQAEADVIVIGLIGERGREVVELLHDAMHDRLVCVAVTSDRPPMERARGARTATAIAEHFRDRGMNVLLVIDSLTRYAMALREIGLAIGEPPATKGYPPSVFAALPRLLERVSPRAGSGSITGFYTVLVEGDDLSDPVADSARSLLDGHIVLSRELAGRGHFPAIDLLASASRVALRISSPEERELARAAREVLSLRQTADELRSLGAYKKGANPAYDKALELGVALDAWSRQAPDEHSDRAAALAGVRRALGAEKGTA